MRVEVSNVLTVREPTQEMIQWCKKNLTIPNPEYDKKLRMHLWVGNTPEKLKLYEQRGTSLILPFGTLVTVPQDGEFVTRFTSPTAIDYGPDVPLYPYQQKAVDAVFAKHFGILQSPAGSGKTQMGIALVKKFGKRALWLTHTIDLLKQSKERAERYMSKDLIGTITGGEVNIGEGITFATVQTMSKIDLAPLKDYWDVIIVDECHRCAGTPTAMTQFYKVLNSLAARHKIGLSATIHRADGMIIATHALLGPIAYTVPKEEVKDNIMKVGIQPIGTGTEIGREAMNTDGTLNYTKLITYLCENTPRTHLIGGYIIANHEYSSLILSERLEHLEALMNTLPKVMRDQAVMISGKMTSKKGKAEREQAIEDMRTGKKKYLFATYSLAKEGLDIPCLERLYLATPQKDYTVITQSIGRIARTCEGKRDPVAFDFVDNIGYLVKSYKRRCATYRKNGCYFVE